MTLALPLGHELKAEWGFRTIPERNYTLSMWTLNKKDLIKMTHCALNVTGN